MKSNGESLRELVGEYFFSILESDPFLYWISTKLFCLQELNKTESLKLSKYPLAVIQKLSNIVIIKNSITQPLRIGTILQIDLAHSIETKGVRKAKTKALDQIQSILSIRKSQDPISISLDRWRGQFRFSDFCSVIRDLLLEQGRELKIIGPSTAEINRTFLSDSYEMRNKKHFIELFLEQLFAVGVTSIEGGSNLETHQLATSLGFTSRFSQGLRRYEEIIETAEVLNQTLAQEQTLESWCPVVLNSHLSYYKCIALGRILMPSVPRIRAPISLLGFESANGAQAFGANDLGYLSLDEKTSRALGVLKANNVEPETETKNSVYARLRAS